ncbi:RtcB family protein [Fulvivirga sp. 29W222]|uniref:3'-phosphate/5'-hydroxy nucleic acid ligase n=1 Tax=Fulvivirga marina TaxID=2494733 RepID=A0A937G1D2_9BACT|nr:RtcB family protein [Fulvivirga marina]MBL6448386.1 RtcB family protein [Fulvivirga marina]
MGKSKLKGKDLRKINYSNNQAISLAIDIISKHYKHSSKEEQLALLHDVKQHYTDYLDHEHWNTLAREFQPVEVLKEKSEIPLLKDGGQFQVFGRKHITSNAYQQMELAMRLPIARKGAMMPDAHQGYGLPIGGVLAAENAAIPYGVGLDIGCRMSLSIYDLDSRYLQKHAYRFKSSLKERTNFGTGGELGITQEHEILDRTEFGATSLLKQLHGKAVKQLGTSGSGNHFVEFGLVSLANDNGLDLPAGEYIGLLSHSGSRGLGASIAKHYMGIAMEKCLLPKSARHLAWLDLSTEEGQEYWLSMNLAGDYAKACHDQIHHHLSKYLGIKPVINIENHHNFAWKEKQAEGEELIVHRKGATPASEGELGIIPGSMTAPGFIVRGKGHEGALQSASHGAGRKMSRQAARESISGSAMKKLLSEHKVTLIGGGTDEAPIAYKNIEEVMKSQKDLVEVIGQFLPKIVRMDKN